MKKLLSILLFFPLILFGQENYSLSFDGIDDYIVIPDFEFESEDISEFSFSTLCKVNQVNHIQNIFRKKWGDGLWLRFKATQDGGQLTFNNGNAGGIVEFETTLYDFSDFHYLSLTYSNAILNLYIDSLLIESINYTPTINTAVGEDLLLGAGIEPDNGDEEHINGIMDNVSFWRTSLSQDEINEYISCPIIENHNDLIACWNFNEGDGYTLFDLSNNDFHGTAYGVTYSQDVSENNCIGCKNPDAINYDENAIEEDEQLCIYSQDYVHGLWNQVDDGAIEFSDYQEQATTSLSSLQQALDTWNTTIDLSAGWNMFGYDCPSSIDVAEGLSNHTESIIITKDNNGNVYMPEFGFNGIGDFTPGFGYQIKLTEAIEGFSLCDWYVNDIPEDNIVSLQDSLQLINSQIGCADSLACNFDITKLYDDGSCEYAEQGYDCESNITDPFIGMEDYGGIIFYIDESGQHGLVAALEDLEGAYEWGCYQQEVNGADGTYLGTGHQNTIDIVNQGCATENGGITAAQAVLYTEINGYSDWYIPSKDELVEMYNTIGNGGSDGNVGNFINNFYWSSSEYINEFFAWVVNFNDGWTVNGDKYYSGRVRVIRSF